MSVRWHTIPPLVGLNITFANDFSGPNPTGTLGAGFGRVYSVQFTTSSGTEGTCGATDVSAKAKLTQLGIYAVPPFVGLFVQTLRIHNGGVRSTPRFAKQYDRLGRSADSWDDNYEVLLIGRRLLNTTYSSLAPT